MKVKISRTIPNRRNEIRPDKNDPEGYPLYPENDDIYGKYHKEGRINPEDPTKDKEPVAILKTGMNNEMDFTDDVSGSDLDTPGSELDDELELIGSEDEENNYYSLGGDNHNDLDEGDIELNP
jgi:hypothetical protein